jgi:aryl-alcohol dehydrogenase-like predicted oxidoreductase
MSTVATPAETESYFRESLKKGIAAEHFREIEGLRLSSIGIGTYLGECDEETDQLYERSLVSAVLSGANVIDTAINYRCQRSERTIKRALSELAAHGVSRGQLFLCTKGGYLPFDGAPPKNPQAYFQERFVTRGILSPSDIVGGSHALTPSFLSDQLAASLENLGCESVDLYYLHNPETQLPVLGRKAFLEAIRKAFECLESLAESGKLRFYGTATWKGYRSPARGKDWLSLEEIVEVAREAGGDRHRFRFVQAPYNLAMTEIFTELNQPVDSKGALRPSGGRAAEREALGVEPPRTDKMVSLCSAADALGIHVVSSASLAQGRLKSGLPDWLGTLFRGSSSDVQRALQFVRSTPGVAIALVGMRRVQHVEENIGTARIPPAPVEDFLKLFEVPPDTAGK